MNGNPSKSRASARGTNAVLSRSAYWISTRTAASTWKESIHLDRARSYREEKTGVPLGEEDVREINANLAGFFGLLLERKAASEKNHRRRRKHNERQVLREVVG